jgi:threonine/homoserine/homoserine lactone efflux protein
MTDGVATAWAWVAPAFALGFALGAAPGPVQLLILSESARRGFPGGVRVMLGANLTMLAILVALALGLSAVEPSDAGLRALQVVGGVVLVWIAANEIRALRGDVPATPAGSPSRRLGPTGLGIVAVLLNPGAWIFFATTATAVIADASSEGGRSAGLLTAVAMALGVSASDFTFTLLGSGGHRLFGERGLHRVRLALAALLGLIGMGFVLRGVAG